MQFAWPVALFALLLLPVAAWRCRVDEARQRAMAAALHGVLPPVAYTRARLVAASVLYISLVLAAAGPRLPWERSADMLFLIDVSRSMQARHACTEPTWLDRAKSVVRGVSDGLPEVRIGMFAFERFAFPVTQLTMDRAYLAEVLEHGLYTGLMLNATRTDIGNALRVVADKKRDLPGVYGNVSQAVLFSDGGVDGNYRPRMREAADRLAEAGIQLSVVGIGNATATPVLHSVDGRCQPRAIEIGGEAVRVQLRNDVLGFLAETAGGRYFQEQDRQALIEQLRANLEPVPAGTAGLRDVRGWFLLLAGLSLLACLYLPSGHGGRPGDVRV